VIRQQIDETRSSLTEKLESLEGQVRGTVQDAKATVECTIRNVKDSVHDTVETVKRTFDVRYQTERHPWAMVGGSVVAGFVIGSLAGRRPRRRPLFNSQDGRAEYSLSSLAAPAPRPESSEPPREERAKSKPGLLSQLLVQFDDEIDQLKKLAVGALVGVVRDWVKQSVPPSLSGQVEGVLNSATTKLGGRPVAGPVLSTSEPSLGRRAGDCA